MCDFSAKLIAWLDNELPEAEAAGVQTHVPHCSECRGQIEAFDRVSRDFDAYCDAMMKPNVRSRLPRPVRVFSGVAAAVAATVALVVSFPRTQIPQPEPIRAPVAAVQPANISQALPARMKNIRRRHVVTSSPDQTAVWQPAEPIFEIAIPAEAMYPPGAVPEGVNFIVDVRMAADGSAQQISLRP